MKKHINKTMISLGCALCALSAIASDEPWQAASGGMALRSNPWRLANWRAYPESFRLVENRHIIYDDRSFCRSAETSKEDACAGLGLLVIAPKTEQPRLYARAGAVALHVWDSVWRVPADLGEITMEGGMELANQEPDWTGNRMSFEGESGAFEITASRLTPAVLFNLAGQSVHFFGGAKDAYYLRDGKVTERGKTAINGPTRWAAGDTDGVITGVADDAIPTEKLQKGWLLVWFGKDSPFVHVKYNMSRHYLQNYGGSSARYADLKTLFPIYQSDVPILFVFEDAPGNAELDLGGLTIEGWADMGEDMKFTAMPLFGEAYPEAAETERWQTKFPEHVRNLCDAWTQRLAAFPVAVSETYGHGPDGATVTGKVEYIELRAGAKRFAPLPPMLALAKRKGLAIQMAKGPIDTGFQTYCGPLDMAEDTDQYSWSLPGLERSVLDKRVAGKGEIPEWITKRLVEEARKIIAAGELAPWRWSGGAGQSFRCELYWTNQAETFYLLSELLPLLPSDAAAGLREYIASLPVRPDAWQPLNEGARREPHAPAYEEESCTYQRWLSKAGRMTRVPLWTVYGWERRRDALGLDTSAEDLAAAKLAFEAEIEGSEWATLAWFPGAGKWPDTIYGAAFGPDDSVGPPRTPWWTGGAHNNAPGQFFHIPIRAVNRHFAGLCSVIRMARALGDTQLEAKAWGRLARTAALRYAMAYYAEHLYDADLIALPSDPAFAADGQIQLRLYSPKDDSRQVRFIDQYGINLMIGDRNYFESMYIPFLDLSPELGRFMNLAMRDKCVDFTRIMGEQTSILWHVAHGWNELGAECCEAKPSDSYQLYMLHAWVLNTAPDELAYLADMPWIPRGDLFYLHKLAACAAAYRGDEWRE